MTIEGDPRLASEPDIQPSSGFVGSVMDAVRQAAAEPAPLPFPWRRYVACVAICLVACAATTVMLLQLRIGTLIEPSAIAALVPGALCATVGSLFTVAALRLARLFS